MASLTLEQKLEMVSLYLQSELKFQAPKDTGNLYLNAIRLVQVEPRYWKIVIGGELAPYGIYTPYTSHRKDWVNIAIRNSMPYINQIMGGSVTMEDVQEVVMKNDELANYDWEAIRVMKGVAE